MIPWKFQCRIERTRERTHERIHERMNVLRNERTNKRTTCEGHAKDLHPNQFGPSAALHVPIGKIMGLVWSMIICHFIK